jgi:2-oxoglutarate dehydrogenase E1 component (EC 1.2.4.2)
MTGQDIGRGTFSHRHAVLHNQKDASTYVPLKNLFPGQPRFDLYDSFLSEEAYWRSNTATRPPRRTRW